MSTPNKYHSSGRMYTAREYADRKHALRHAYLVVGYSHEPLVQTQQRVTGDCKPYNVGRNAQKRQARAQGFKSLKQASRSHH